MKLKNKKIWCTVMIIVIVAIDQITKYFAKTYLLGNGAKPFIKGVVEFVYAQNTGVAFSLFDGGRWFFIALTLAVTVLCIIYMYIGLQLTAKSDFRQVGCFYGFFQSYFIEPRRSHAVPAFIFKYCNCGIYLVFR